MSIEAIQRISEAEELAKKQKQEASAQAKELVRSAEAAGQRLLNDARTAAGGQAKSAMALAEQAASDRAEEIYAQTRKVCDDLSRQAEKHLEAAADLIVKRIVSVSWPS